MRPGLNIHAVLGGLCAGALLVPLVPELSWPLLVLLVLLVAVAVGEYVVLRRIHLSVERQEIFALPLDEPSSITESFRTDSKRAVRLTVRQIWPHLIDERSSTRKGVCGAGEILHLDFPVRGIARGTEELPPPFAFVSLWGFAERRVRVGEPALLNVLPNLNSVKRVDVRLNQLFLRGLGHRVAPRLGKGRDFDRLREYVRGDDYRDISWKATARHSKLIVKEYRLDRSQDVLLCIDRGHRMASRVHHMTRVDHAVNASVLISYVCNRMEDKVGLLSFACDVEQGIAQGRGPAHLRQTTVFATGIKADFIHTDYLALAANVKRRLNQRALILIMTVLPESGEEASLLKAVKMLTPKHLPLVLAVSDPRLKAAAHFLPASHAELCHNLVARDVWLHHQQVSRELRQMGAMVVETKPEDIGVEGINAYIETKQRQLI